MLRRRFTAAVLTALLLTTAAGCAASAPAATPTAPPTSDPVVDLQGFADIRFGDQRDRLEQEHALTQQPGACAPTLPGHPELSPVFADDRLVLLWVNPPGRTPEGVGVGSPVDAVQQHYPDGQELTAPADSGRFDGLLVTVNDRAYLFLHDGATVQKLIIGYADYARLLFEEGFGTC